MAKGNVYVYVQNIDGEPLMPTRRCGKVRRMLKSGQAVVVKREPFTIKLTYETTDFIQDVTLGVDAGSKTVGVSACTKTEEVYASEVELRDDITDNLGTRREYRRSRRNRKKRYRKPRFNNRVHSKNKGWLAPSVEAKTGTHIRVIKDIMKILPISKMVIEGAAFDTQKIKAILNGEKIPEGTDYQKGEQSDFFNVREYVLHRDNHICRCCKGKSKDKILEVHHIVSRKTGGDSPNNLVTLCRTCHENYHRGIIDLPDNIKKPQNMKDAAFMGIMRWTLYNRLKEEYPDMVKLTYGYITKSVRIEHDLEKSHTADARCIAGCPDAKELGYYFYQKKVRNHNRQLHKANILKGGIRKSNQAPKYVEGFRLFDKVKYNNVECFIFGRRSSGYFDIRKLDKTKVHASVSYKKLKLIERSKTLLTERRMRRA